MLVEELNPGPLEALAYGSSIAPDHLVAMTVVNDEQRRRADREAVVASTGSRVPLEIVHTADRRVHRGDAAYIEELEHRWPEQR